MPAKPAGPRDVATGGRLKPFLPLALLSTLLLPIDAATAVEPGAIERDLVVTMQGKEQRGSIDIGGAVGQGCLRELVVSQRHPE